MAMFEYIIASSMHNGYSGHLESTTLATGQAMQSYFLRSNQYYMKDGSCSYTIDTEKSDFNTNHYFVSVTHLEQNKKEVVEYKFPSQSALSFWVYKFVLPSLTDGGDEGEFMYEQVHNLINSSPIPCTLANSETIFILKYEPMDCFILQ